VTHFRFRTLALLSLVVFGCKTESQPNPAPVASPQGTIPPGLLVAPSHAQPGGQAQLPPGHPAVPGAGGGTEGLPPGHMPTGADPGGAAAGSSALAWDAPKTWKSMPNPSAMRKATYSIPRAAGDAEDADLSVMEAGGGVDPNVERWAGQFEGGKESLKKTSKTVSGFKVTVVDVQGTFAGGGMGGASGAKPSWALLGAIVEVGGSLWFFKMTGPAKTVAAARPEFDKLVSSFKPGATP
jgi:hypothetical protein